LALRPDRLATTAIPVSTGWLLGDCMEVKGKQDLWVRQKPQVMAECSRGRHEGAREIAPWWSHFLGVLGRAYLEFARQVESVASRPAKGDLVRQTVSARVGPFTLADLSGQMPAVSAPLIKKVLAEMKRKGQVRLVGHGRGAYWENAGSRKDR
jgi:hypothetical protein